MAAQLTGMTNRLASGPITQDATGTGELRERLMARMTKSTMPQVGRGSRSSSDKCRGRLCGLRSVQVVEGPRTIAPGDHVPGTKILHRKAERVKFDGAMIISGELSNGDEFLNNMWSNKDIIKIQRTR